MSEITTTTTIEDVELRERQPSISLADILGALGTVAFHGTRLAVKGAVAGTKLACAGIKAGGQAIKARRLRMSEIDTVVHSSKSAGDALATLAATPGFEMPKESVGTLKAKVATLVASNDKAGVSALARQLRRASQERLCTNLMSLTADACREIGFEVVTERPLHGLLTAKSKHGPGMITVEIARETDGGAKLHCNTDGFHGSACVEATNALQSRLAAKGVRFGINSRRRKDRSPAFDGRRVGVAQRQRGPQQTGRL
jgi:hypothetical protein